MCSLKTWENRPSYKNLILTNSKYTFTESRVSAYYPLIVGGGEDYSGASEGWVSNIFYEHYFMKIDI